MSMLVRGQSLLGPIKIGEKCLLIGANAVVIEIVPDNSIAAGGPAGRIVLAPIPDQRSIAKTASGP